MNIFVWTLCLPIALAILAYLAICAVMAKLRGEFEKRYQLPPLNPNERNPRPLAGHCDPA